MKRVHIFKTGQHTDSGGTSLAFSDSDVAAIASGYNPDLHEAPIVVGHPAADAPAYGWVQGLDFADGDLTAIPHQVDAAFQELVEAGRFKKVSASFYTPDAPTNPTPGAYYLRHVGFLGAQPPAVKGLRAAEFSAGEEGVVEFHSPSGQFTIASLWRSMRDWFLTEHGQETADQVVPGYLVEDLEAGARDSAEMSAAAAAVPFSEPGEVDAMTEQELQQREAALTTAQEALAAERATFEERVTALDTRAAAIREREARAFCEDLVRERRILPAEIGGHVAFMATLDDQEAVIDFGEGDKKTKLTALAAYQETLKARKRLEGVSFQEHSAAGAGDGDVEDLDQAQAVMIGQRARDYAERQRLQGITITAVDAVAAVREGRDRTAA